METQQPLYMGIEIGGTKLQVGVGDGVSTTLYVLERRTVDKNAGAEGILRQLGELVPPLTRRFPVAGIGVGFGGPVDPTAGRVIRSHQVAGWENFAIRDWLRKRTGCPVVVGNDCDCAALAEATLGAGRGKQVVFYVT
ncbi:MAG: ROK family protein, partial [Planctomycetota bacterium]